MSHTVFIATLACLAAVCLAAPLANYASLSNPVIMELEQAMTISVATVKVPEFQPKADDPNEGLKRIAYDVTAGVYEHSGLIYERIWILRRFDEMRNVVVEDALKSVQAKLHAGSQEEAKKTILGACEGLIAEAKPALAEANAIKDSSERQAFLYKDESLLRLAKLDIFCKFLQ